MTRSDDIDEHALYCMKNDRRKRNEDETTTVRHRERDRESVEQEKVADHLDVISNRIEMQIEAQMGARRRSNKNRRREHEDRHDRDHEMRDITGNDQAP